MARKEAQLQAEYCKKNRLPLFAPENGICWYCKRPIYASEGGPIPEEKAATCHITGCPLCTKTYCD